MRIRSHASAGDRTRRGWVAFARPVATGLVLALWAGGHAASAGEPDPGAGSPAPRGISAGAGAGELPQGVKPAPRPDQPPKVTGTLSGSATGAPLDPLRVPVSTVELVYPDPATLPRGYATWLPQLQLRQSSEGISVEPGGAQLTVVSLTHQTAKGRVPLKSADLGDSPPDMKGCLLVARINADALWTRISKEPIRREGVLVGYRLRSKEGEAGAVVLGTEFLLRCESDLGPRLYVVVPSQNRAYVFRAEPGAMDGVLQEMETVHREATATGSLEVFEVTQDALRAVGVLGR